MEEFHRIQIVIVEDEIEQIVDEMEGGESDEEDESHIDPRELAERMKEKGGECYRERRFDDAIGFYLRGLEILELEQGLREKKGGVELVLGELVLRSNCIACYVEKKDFDLAISESRRLIAYAGEEEASYLREKGDLPVLWVNIKNKTLYRLSLSIYSLLGEKTSLCEKELEALVKESFGAIRTVLEYYQEELKVPPPQEVAALYSKVKRALEAQDTRSGGSLGKEQSQGRDCTLDPEPSDMQYKYGGGAAPKQSETHYLRSYLRCLMEQEERDLEPGSHQRSIPSPIPVVDKMSCRNSAEFLRIWQNISREDRFLDYYLLFSQLFTKVDKLFSKTEMEVNTLERILERISSILDELTGTYPSTPKENLVRHMFIILQNLGKTSRFDFVVLMLPGNFRILDKMTQLHKASISASLLQEIKHFRDTQVSKGIHI